MTCHLVPHINDFFIMILEFYKVMGELNFFSVIFFFLFYFLVI